MTREWILKKAKAVVLVVNRSGVTHDAARLLKDSEFLLRLLYSVDDPDADPVVLLPTGVQLDIVAEHVYSQDRTKKKREHFAEVRDKMSDQLRYQLRQQLQEAWTSGDQKLLEAKREVIDRIAARARVYTVSAVQYRRLLAQDEDDPAFIKELDESGIPQMIEGIREIVEARRGPFRDVFATKPA